MADLRTALEGAGLKPAPRPVEFSRVRQELIDAGLIRESDGWVPQRLRFLDAPILELDAMGRAAAAYAIRAEAERRSRPAKRRAA